MPALNIAAAAAARGFQVTAFARHLPREPLPPGVRHEVGSLEDQATMTKALTDADVVVSAVAPRGETEKRLRPAMVQLASEAAEAGVRLGIVGGAGSLLVAEGGPALVDTGALPEQARTEGRIMAEVLSDLGATDGALDWVPRLTRRARLGSSSHPPSSSATSHPARPSAPTASAAMCCFPPPARRKSPDPTSPSPSSTRSSIPNTIANGSRLPTDLTMFRQRPAWHQSHKISGAIITTADSTLIDGDRWLMRPRACPRSTRTARG